MASLMAALKRSKSGGFTARKAIPASMRLAYARLYAVGWEEKLSIPAGTSLHEAKMRCGEWIAEIENRISTLRAGANGEGQPLTKHNAHALAGRWYSWFLAKHENDKETHQHWAAMGEHLIWDIIYPLAPDEFHEDTAADPHWEWKEAPEIRAKVRPVVAEIARTASFLIAESMTLTPNANNLFLDVVEGNLLAAFARLEQLARGDFTPDETPKRFPEFVESRKRTQEGLRCWALYEAWVTAVKPSAGTRQRWHVVLKALDVEFSSVESVNLARARIWMNGLINNGRSARTIATVWRTALKTVFAWGLGQDLVKANPFKEIKFAVPKKTQERESKAFTVAEAQLILKAALQYSKPQTVDEGARRWVPWLCAYTGARGGEITQLRGSDVTKRGSSYFAKLSPSAGKIKTGKGRTVPLHEHLIDQGFYSFVQARGQGPLFYIPVAERKGKDDVMRPKATGADRARERIGTWVRTLGIIDPELSPNHAWRHTFKAQAARSGIDVRYNDAITGHAPATVGQSYGAPIAEDLAKAMKKFPRYIV
jgi:integrase